MQFRRTTVFMWGFLSFLLGLGFARTGWLISYELVISLIMLWIITVLRLRWLAIISTLLMAFALGWLRGQLFMPEVKAVQALDGVKVIATVTADSDLYYNKRAQLTFDARNLRITEPEEQTVPGRLAVSGFGESAIFKGDEVQITGRLYTTRGSKQLGMSFAELEKIESHPSAIQDIRREFGAGLATAVPEPAASLGLGLLIGQRSTLPEHVAAALSAVGLTHIVAVSGYNLTIIMRGVKSLLSKRSKYQITMLSLLLIGIFLLMTGMSASIVRAALVSGLSILAWHYGRTFRPLLLLSLVAAVTAAWNPFYVWSDIGWYLSFLAFFGVLVIAPAVQKRLFGEKQLKLVLVVCIESMSAMLMTLPLIMFIFERVSIVALLANILVVPLVPLAMLTAAFAGVAGMIAPVLAGLIAWPATTLLTAMLDIVSLLARIPFAQVSQGMPLFGMLLCYSAILFATHIVWRVNQKTGKITEINTE
jgi:competence protein ComEC